MADLNAGIILAGRQPDPLGYMARGNALAQQQNEMMQQRQLQDLYRTQGAGILNGDPGAMNALAGVNPMAAMDMRQAQQGYRMNEENLKIAKENARLRGAELAATMDARQRAETAAQIEKAIAMGTQAQTPEQWDQIMSGLGEAGQQFVGQFDKRNMIIAGAVGLAEAMKMGQGEDEPADVRSRRILAGEAGLQPGTPEYQTYMATGKLAGTAAAIDPEGESSLRKEYTGLAATKSFAEQAQAYGRIEAAASDPSPAGDLALIFNYMKVLDPGSVVRESEFATAQNAAAVPDQVRNLYNRVLSGERLNPQQRNDFVGTARRLYKSAEQGDDSRALQYRNTAEQYGYDAGRVVPDLRFRGQGAPLASVRPRPQADGLPVLRTAPPSAEAVDLLRSNPTREYRAFFDQVFGPGAAAQILGD